MFTEVYESNGNTIHPGVVIAGEFTEDSDSVSLIGYSCFSNIPKAVLAEFSVLKKKVKRAKKEGYVAKGKRSARVEAKTQSEIARIGKTI